MSEKVLKPLLIGAAVIAIGVATGGIGFGAAGLVTTGLGGIALSAGTGLILSSGTAALAKNPKATLNQLDRLNATVNPGAPRKLVFGETAFALDTRYNEPSGATQEYVDYIIAVGGHGVTSYRELWIEDLLAWTATGGVQGKFAGYLTVDTRTEGSASNVIPINGGGKWGATRRLTGCAYIHLRIKRTGNSKKAESPFVSGLSSRLTVIGRGMPVYDPRLDSTVPGGSGPQRVTDQSTWAFDSLGLEQGRNPALQTLAYMLGWRINGKLSVGAGTPASRIDLQSFITAANLCDEPVTLTAGGTQKRYQAAGVFSEADDPASTLTGLAVACNGALQDAGGRLAFHVRHNDLAAVAVDLTDDDVLSSGTWEPVGDLTEAYNIIRGRYCDPSPNSLYQLVDYPEVRIDSPDGVDRVLTLDLPLIDDPRRAQRIAKQVLQRRQYQGKFTATFGARAWKAKVGDIVRLTLSAAGWVNKPFRVEGQGLSITGACPMVLREDAAQVYAWDRDEAPAVQAQPPTVYDPTNAPYIRAVLDGTATYADGTTLEERKPAELGADVTATALPGAWQVLTSRTPQQVVDDLNGVADSVATAILAGEVYRGETDDILHRPDGTTIYQYVDALGVKVGDAEAVVAFLKRVGTDGSAEFGLLARNSRGEIVGIQGVSDDETRQLSFVSEQFLFVDNSGGNARQVMTYSNGWWQMTNVVVDTLKVNTAVVPSRVSATAPVQGGTVGQASNGDILPGQTAAVLTTTVIMPVPGWIELLATAKQNFGNYDHTKAYPWCFQGDVNGTDVETAISSGQQPGDSVVVAGSFRAATPGTYTIRLRWAGHADLSLAQRTLFVKGFPATT